MAFVLVLAACSPPPDFPASTTPPSDHADRPPQAAHAGPGLQDLRQRARLALRDQRIYAPAGDNAMEYFIALRNGSKQGDLSAANALMELQPYAVIAAEQAMDRKDFIEAERLRRLVAAADPQAPSLARIASAIASGLRGDTKVIPEEKPATSEVEAVIAAAPALAPTGAKAAVPGPISAPVSRATASVPVAGPPLAAVTAPADFQAPVTIAGRPPAAAPALASRLAGLIAVRTPPPEYPEEKRRKGEAGLVVASFTVNSDGTVGEVRTESIGSRQLAFERSVARAVKRWKYQPPGESRSVTQSFSLAP